MKDSLCAFPLFNTWTHCQKKKKHHQEHIFIFKQDAKLKKVIENLLGKKVLIDYVINPKILGGLRVQCGSKMFDNSLINKLNYLENIMKGK